MNSLKLYQNALPSVETTLWTQPAGWRRLTVITEFVLCNTSASPATCALSIVPAGQVAGNANRLVNGMTLAPGQTEIIASSGEPLFWGDAISGLQQTGPPSAITLTVNATTVP